MIRTITLASLTLLALVSGFAAGEEAAPGDSPGGTISMNLEACRAISEAREALKWTYIDKKAYLRCERDSDCTTSWHFGACGGVVNQASAKVLELEFAKSCEVARLNQLEHRNLCPKPMCAAPPFVRCENRACARAPIPN